MFGHLAAQVARAPGLPNRAWVLDTYRRVLDGTLYDVLSHEFFAEKNTYGEYIPLRQRKPAVRYNLCATVVNDSVSFLFGEGRFPAVECPDKAAQEHISRVLDNARAVDAFTEAATQGSVGSVGILFRVLRGRVFLDTMKTGTLTPVWAPDEPDCLAAVHEAYPIKGDDLRAAGYAIPDALLKSTFIFRRMWDDIAETWFVPQLLADESTPTIDTARSVTHALGFVPFVWIKNLPGGTAPDGGCTFAAAIDASIEIDYQLSQAGRGLKYSSDPLLLIKEPAAADDGEYVRSAGNAMVVSEKGDAKLLEIGGSAAAAVIEYVRVLRELAMESIHGNRASPEKLAAAQSGRAMELLYAPLLNLVDRLRSSYGRGLMDVVRMIVLASGKLPLTADGEKVPDLTGCGRVTLKWPPYFPPTHVDMQSDATTLGALRREGLMSQETAVRRTAATHDIGDADEEMARIRADEAAADKRALARGDQIQDRQTLPA